uniref:Uncharacterized protein n=1 Tax=viral metagenome TaxID=1070528 RepID=A0A6C0E9C0_9ZZZZ
MSKKLKYCECQGPEYQGCLPISNGLYACYKKSGEIDHKKGCLGEKQKGNDNVEGWTKGCQSLTYAELKDRVTKWCGKLLQEGVYDQEDYQKCLKNLDVGTIDDGSYLSDLDLDKGKEVEHLYGYYQVGRNKLNPIDPSKKVIENDYQKMLIQHGKTNFFLIANGDGDISLSANPEKFNERDWQIVDLGKDQNYALRSNYGRYLIGQDTDTVKANRDQMSPWAQWVMEQHDHQYAFYSVIHKKYLTVAHDQVVLRDGWNDLNLWNVTPRTEVKGGFLGNFNNSEMILQKDNLLSDLTTFNTNRVENQTKYLSLTEKKNTLRWLRDKQKQFMLNMSTRVKDKLLNENKKLTDDMEKLDGDKTKEIQVHDAKAKKILNKDPETNYQFQRQREQIVAKFDSRQDEYKNKIANNKDKLDDLNKYMEEVSDYFTVIKEKESEKFGELIAKYYKITEEWKKKSAEKNKEITEWIKKIGDDNKKLENEIDGARNEISIQLEDINNIHLNIENDPSPNDFKEVGDINQTIRDGQVDRLKKEFYIMICIIIAINVLIGYLGYHLMNKLY